MTKNTEGDTRGKNILDQIIFNIIFIYVEVLDQMCLKVDNLTNLKA